MDVGVGVELGSGVAVGVTGKVGVEVGTSVGNGPLAHPPVKKNDERLKKPNISNRESPITKFIIFSINAS
jgi:hypothetical protein